MFPGALLRTGFASRGLLPVKRSRFWSDISGVRFGHTPSSTLDQLLPQIKTAVANANISSLTEIQARTIEEALLGKDVFCVAQTGTGKTLAFLLPIIHQLKQWEALHGIHDKPGRPLGLVLVPSKELAEQVASVAGMLAHHVKFRAVVATGNSDIGRQKSDLRKPFDLLVATPGRLLTHRKFERLHLSYCSWVAIDEADTMFSKALGFKQDVETIVDNVRKGAEYRGRKPQFILAAATVQSPLDKVIEKSFAGIEVVTGTTVHQAPKRLQQDFVKTAPAERFRTLATVLTGKQSRKTLVFCNSGPVAQAAAHYLSENGLPAVNLHSDMPAYFRDLNFQKFLDGSVDILLSTDVAARGLDISDIDHVVMLEAPKTITDYLHRAGRTARFGRKGHVTVLYTSKDQQLIGTIKRALEEQGAMIKSSLVEGESSGTRIRGGDIARPGRSVRAAKGEPGEHKRTRRLSSRYNQKDSQEEERYTAPIPKLPNKVASAGLTEGRRTSPASSHPAKLKSNKKASRQGTLPRKTRGKGKMAVKGQARGARPAASMAQPVRDSGGRRQEAALRFRSAKSKGFTGGASGRGPRGKKAASSRGHKVQAKHFQRGAAKSPRKYGLRKK